ncbi:hypothetical protein CYMTET_34513, partial [Cymbomonas tetramitiformis]
MLAAAEAPEHILRPMSIYLYLAAIAPAALPVLLPAAVRALAGGRSELLAVTLVYRLARLLSTIPVLLLADRFGRAHLLHAAPLLNGMAVLLPAAAFGFPSLVITAGTLGTGLGITSLVGRLMVADVSAAAAAGTGMAYAVAPVFLAEAFGPWLANPMYQSKLGVTTALTGQAIICIASVGYGAQKVPETLERHNAATWPGARQLAVEYMQAMTPEVTIVLLAVALHATLYSGLVLHGVPALCEDHCPRLLEPLNHAMALSGLALFPTLAAPLAGLLADAQGPLNVLLGAGLLLTGAALLAAAASTTPTVLAAAALAALGFGAVLVSAAAVLMLAAPRSAGGASKVQALLSLATDFGSLLGAALLHRGSAPLSPKAVLQGLAISGALLSVKLVARSSPSKGGRGESRQDRHSLITEQGHRSLRPDLVSRRPLFAFVVALWFGLGIFLTSGPPTNHNYEHGPMVVGPTTAELRRVLAKQKLDKTVHSAAAPSNFYMETR